MSEQPGVLRALWPVAWPVLTVSVVAAGIALAVEGWPGVLGALLAGVVVTLFLGSTPVVLTPVARSSPALSLPVALLFYVVKAFAAMAALLLLFDVGGVADHVDRTTFGLVAVACTLTWTALYLRAFQRARVPTYDLDNSP